jgi:SulP family sulfate permease
VNLFPAMTKGALIGDLWGGLAAMLVAVPSAIAFGVSIYAPLGGVYPAYGAMAGIVGAIALGLVSPLVGGTDRLITAPCAPAAAVLSAFALHLVQGGTAPEAALVVLALTGVLAGVLQVGLGGLRLGQLIKFMPYPVVSGYLSGVGVVIVVGQVPLWLGVAKETAVMDAVRAPALWNWTSVAVGVATMAVMAVAPRFVRAVPAAILGLAAGIATYFALAVGDPALLDVGNPLVVGPLDVSGESLRSAPASLLAGIGAVRASDLVALLMPAATLAVLLSIDTLKTCVVLDAMTRTRHNSNRELLGQGAGNVVSALAGGMPGAGQMGATAINLSSGARTRLSGTIEGVLALAALVLVGGLVAWVPIPALAGILIVVGLRMIDWKSLRFLRSRATVLDFMIILAVIAAATTIGLITASAVGVALAILLFVREQVGGSVVHGRSLGDRRFSRQVRLPGEMAVLQARGAGTVVFELQGSLFFGTADQLYRALAPELDERRFVVLDMRRVQSVDVTAAHVLEQVEDRLAEHGGTLVFAHPPRLPSGRDVADYLGQVGLVREGRRVHVFDELDQALEWIESTVLEEAGFDRSGEAPLALREIDMFRNRRDETLVDLEACMTVRVLPAGTRLFRAGEASDELYLIRRGAVRVEQPLHRRAAGHHLATFNRGDFIGEMAFLDREPRSADAYAERETELFVLSRSAFDAFAERHRKAALDLLEGLARTLSLRLRFTNAEVRNLEEG